ncbi:MAG: elements of external origin, partial [Gammaproteobacteria bacterium]
LVDRAQAIGHVFTLARAERDAWLNWPSRISAQISAELRIDPHALHVMLEREVRRHLEELGSFQPRVD